MEDAVYYLETLGANLPQLQTAFYVIVALMGFIVFCIGWYDLIKVGGMQGAAQQTSLFSAFMTILCGVAFLSISTFMDIGSASIWGSYADPKSIDVFTPLSSGDKVRDAMYAVIVWINFFGWITFAAGWFAWQQGPKYQAQGWFKQGLIRIAAGLGMVNFAVFVDMIAVSVGADPIGTLYFDF